MAFKRLIGVITVRDGVVVKSIGYDRYHPQGSLKTAIENLDRWRADEIVIIDISRRSSVDSRVVSEIKKANMHTPLVYGGGIRELSDIKRLLEIGCDRFVFERLLLDQSDVIFRAADMLGEQAVIGSLPLSLSEKGEVLLTRVGDMCEEPLINYAQSLKDNPVSEYFISSVKTDGKFGEFSQALVQSVEDLFAHEIIPKRDSIWFGGLDTVSAAEVLRFESTKAVAFGNINMEKEINIPLIRNEMNHLGFRK